MSNQPRHARGYSDTEGGRRLPFQSADQAPTSPIDGSIAKIDRQRKWATEDFGSLLEIINLIFTNTGGKPKYFSTLTALLGICKGRFDYQNERAVWFSASREALVDAIVGHDNGAQKASQLKAVGRAIDRLLKNQDDAGVTWVEYRRGHRGYKGRKPTSSKFRLVILEPALKAYERARADPDFYTLDTPGSKWKAAALEAAGTMPRQQQATSKPKKKRTIDDARRQAMGATLSWLRTLQEAGVDVFRIERDLQNFYSAALSHIASEPQGEEAA